ncbi:MAG: hypothetical protein KatS3mg103_0064 [Phycisphaerales bacterium]|nr:MAG: hypothetical protein KatS3mg103_0064 [Phycisphaerales bacterium]
MSPTPHPASSRPIRRPWPARWCWSALALLVGGLPARAQDLAEGAHAPSIGGWDLPVVLMGAMLLGSWAVVVGLLVMLVRRRAAVADLHIQLEGFFETSTELLCIADFQGRLLKVNQAWSTLLGVEAGDLRLRRFMEFVHPDDREATRQRMAVLARGQSVSGFRNRYQGADGLWHTLEWRGCVRRGRIFAAARDLTSQLEMERALTEQAERTELALAGGELGAWDWEIATDRLSVDERWAAMIGLTVEEVGQTTEAWSSRLHPEDLPLCMERLERYFQHGEPYQDVLFRMRHRDGSWRWIQASGKVVSRDADNNPIRMVGTHADVTDRIDAQRRRAEANKRMELALQAGRMGLWDWDLDTGEFGCDARWAAMLGLEPEDVLPDASTLLSRVHPDDLPGFEQAIARHDGRPGVQMDCQFRVRRQDGSWRWVHVFATSPDHDAQGNPRRLVGIQMDVHEQVLAQQALARREAILANTARLTRVGGWELDLLTMQPYWSDAVRAIHEVPDDYEPDLERAIEFYAPEDRPIVRQAVERAIEHGEPFEFECRFITAKGNHRWVRSVGEPVYENGRVVRLTGAFQDITEHRAQRQALEESNRDLEVAQAIARMGSWSHDPQTGRTRWSKQLYEIFEVPPERGPLGIQEVLEQFVPEDAQALRQAIDKALKQGRPYALTLRRANPSNGMHHLAIDGRVRTDEHGKVVELFGTTRDVTAEVQREAALREAQLRAEDASRSKTEFLANMSHEIRTPMTAILGYADLLADPNLSEQQRAEHLGTIKRNGEHLLTIINDILDISKIEAGRMVIESVDASPQGVLLGVARLLHPQAVAKGLDLTLHRQTSIPGTIRTDPTRLRQVLLNLVGNAIKFTQAGSVSVSMRYDDALGRLCYEIADTGIGMTPDQVKRCFLAFNQADASTTRRFGGTGLGLYISKRLAQALGGDVAVRSTPGRGSVFTLSLRVDQTSGLWLEPGPISLQTEADAGKDDRPASPAQKPLEGLRILLMEDGPDNLRLITTMLRKSGAQVITAGNGLEGLAALSADGTPDGPLMDPLPVDVIISDMQMPELDGYQAVGRLRDKGCDAPIVALTAHAMADDRARCLDAGCDDYASKPITDQRLVEVIQRAIVACRDRRSSRAA